MIQDYYVIYSSEKAAEEMFQAMNLTECNLTFNAPDYIDEETASAILDLALIHGKWFRQRWG